jgi:hypothetical protein
MKYFLTIDLDFFNYQSSELCNEFELAFSLLKKIFIKYPFIKTTWFIRLDPQIEDIYGEADYIFKTYSAELNWLRENGHEIGWHFHAFMKKLGNWVQNTIENEIVSQLLHCGYTAKSYGLNIVRMGWGYQTNITMRTIDRIGFLIDSSAIPRPAYPWETTVKNWNGTPDTIYHPSTNDYRVPGNPSLNILEFPMSVCELEALGDTMKVKRYLNTSYKSEYFKLAYSKLSERLYINSIMHPYEILPNSNNHPLLSFNTQELEKNLEFLIEKNSCFKTVSEILTF